ncbi:hypothetical protein NliqN6_1067 [Naganishia liquefaciens]|uniref:Uncharacterized protein n=1 Tax=Naganishia liquefaciens TaxID=104408 RepID=A0A8H3TP65_9TREE|nr:hypothetical protein NliqN6_1067 [Naganishia liquefaciens]
MEVKPIHGDEIHWDMEMDSASVTARQVTADRGNDKYTERASLHFLIHPQAGSDAASQAQIDWETCSALGRALGDSLDNSLRLAAEYEKCGDGVRQRRAAAFDTFRTSCQNSEYDSTEQNTQETLDLAGSVSGSTRSQHATL